MSRKKAKYKVTIIQSDTRITEAEIKEIKEIIVKIIAEHIVKNGLPHNENQKK